MDAAEDDRLAQEPLSQDKIAALQAALRETLNAEQRLAAEIPTVADVPDIADKSRPILGMNSEFQGTTWSTRSSTRPTPIPRTSVR